MVLVDSAVEWACEKHNRPLRCGCIEHIKGGRYANGRNHHPPVLHGRRPTGHCQQTRGRPSLSQRDRDDWLALCAQGWALSRLLPLVERQLSCLLSGLARTNAPATPPSRPRRGRVAVSGRDEFLHCAGYLRYRAEPSATPRSEQATAWQEGEIERTLDYRYQAGLVDQRRRRGGGLELGHCQ